MVAIAYEEISLPEVKVKEIKGISVIDAYFSLDDEELPNRTGDLLELLGKLIETLLHDQ